jgi:hypothetical protein
MDQMEKKVEEAREREGKRRERRKVWDEVNSGANGAMKRGSGKGIFGGSVGDAEWEDVEDANGDGDKKMEGVDGHEVPAEGAFEGIESTSPAEPAEPVVVEGQEVGGLDQTTNLNGIEVEEEDEIT